MTNHSFRSWTAHAQGTRNQPIQRHYWNPTDGREMQQFRQDQTGQDLKDFSQIQGESLGDRYATDILGYQVIMHGDDKSIAQGLDGLYWDDKRQELVVMEFKGQSSTYSSGQKRPDWSISTCQKIQDYQKPYQNVSDYERQFATEILQHYDRGEMIRYEAVRTDVDMKTGEWWSQLEKQQWMEQEFQEMEINPEL
ncbi:MAG: hypothetical protein ACO3EZ_15720 [Prochlorotrichaceae cyanobacterium]|jgi:hypothetical protein